jgi:hypothetical protein
MNAWFSPLMERVILGNLRDSIECRSPYNCERSGFAGKPAPIKQENLNESDR